MFTSIYSKHEQNQSERICVIINYTGRPHTSTARVVVPVRRAARFQQKGTVTLGRFRDLGSLSPLTYRAPVFTAD